VRDILFVSICLGLVPVFLRRPWIGILGWYGVAYFVPQGISWGFARSFPFAMVVGSATLLGFIFTKDRKPLPRNAATFFMLACTVQFTLTTIVAFNQDDAWAAWSRVMKILLMTFVTMTLFQDRARLRWLYMVPALGLGFHGVKGLLWVLRTAGGGAGYTGDAAAAEGGRIFGPDMSFFADANGIGPALCMILPLLLYLSREEERWWLRFIFKIAFVCSIVSAIFTYSRGTFLGLAIVGLVLIWRSPWRLRFAIAVLVVGILAAPLAPERLWVRLASITQQQSAETRDASSASRVESFRTAWNIAVSRPFTGVGFKGLSTAEVWAIYYGSGFRGTFDPHSIYFEVLGEHGLLGFALYMGLIVSILLMLRRLRKRWRDHPEHGYLSRYAEMTQLALYPFLVCGAFIPFAMFDLYFLLVATTSMLYALSQEAESAEEAQRAEAARLAPPRRRPLSPRPAPAALPTRPRQRPRHV
jgi:probable O-glycosylation ligase (exosortase A-associated)